MATPDQVQAQLDTDTSGRHARIINAFEGATKTDYFVVTDVDNVGNSGFAQCNTSDSAAVQAASILTQTKPA